MPDMPTLTGPRLVLRAPVNGDAAACLALGRDAEVLAGYGVAAEGLPPLTEASCAAWLAEQWRADAWMIEVEGTLAGSVRLHSHAPEDARAQIAIGMLAARFMGRGLGPEALGLVFDHAFGPMGLHRIGLRVLADNMRAIRAYLSLGFAEEGREREAARTASGWTDDIVMGLLARDWRGAAA